MYVCVCARVYECSMWFLYSPDQLCTCFTRLFAPECACLQHILLVNLSDHLEWVLSTLLLLLIYIYCSVNLNNLITPPIFLFWSCLCAYSQFHSLNFIDPVVEVESIRGLLSSFSNQTEFIVRNNLGNCLVRFFHRLAFVDFPIPSFPRYSPPISLAVLPFLSINPTESRLHTLRS